MTAWLLTMMGRLDPSPRFGRRPGRLAQLLGYPAGMASKAGNRRALLVGGGLVAFAVAEFAPIPCLGFASAWRSGPALQSRTPGKRVRSRWG